MKKDDLNKKGMMRKMAWVVLVVIGLFLNLQLVFTNPATLYGKHTAIEYENDSKADAVWDLYDVDEYAAGLIVLFNW
jgi:hypothetical protein